MRKNQKIVVVGSSNMDLISYTQHLPKPGETIRGHKFKMGYGGKGANQAVMTAHLGADTVMVCKIGTDVFGQQMIQNFDKKGIDVKHVYVTDEASTGVAPISVCDNGENSIIIVPGANDLLTPQDIEQKRDIFKQSSILLTQLEVPLETTITALRMAKEEGITTILNPAPAQKLPKEIYSYIDILCLNETELEFLSGKDVSAMENIVNAAKSLLGEGVKKSYSNIRR